jgi:cytochrome bd-type quinol oxidase subunit 1
MDYPLFLVPYIGGSWLIGGNAILHVVIAHFAIGGGILLAAMEQRAARRGDHFRLDFVRRLSHFLVLVSTVLGALTGVGIWFTIGLVHPAATSLLIHTFVWGWAIEWAFFIVEIAAALLYVATWDAVSRRTHVAIAWTYAVAAYASLVVINGIVTFMLTPGRWLETQGFWDGFFNPTYGPSLMLRTGVALMLAAAVGLLVAARTGPSAEHRELSRALAGWGLAGSGLALPGLLWWQARVPATARDLFAPADGLLRTTATVAVAALALFALLMVLGLAAPRAVGTAVALAALVLAGTHLGAYERVREGGRKPFVLAGIMYSNGIRVDEADRLDREGLLAKTRWAGLGRAPLSAGEQVFRAQCQMCHSLDGYLAIRPLVAGQDAEGLAGLLDALRGGRPGMPPVVGTEHELQQLAAYLADVAAAPGAVR